MRDKLLIEGRLAVRIASPEMKCDGNRDVRSDTPPQHRTLTSNRASIQGVRDERE
ncbi:hypothetical protein SAMN05216516_10425 [Izhakiella capsodis]|uniref:Uncharacterized protein n=1 Tax=Izhakiella capsodis TaxID=1367852 RepID=A0A1I4XB54_9GAMM|nr:hypothetical protein [Izhakiella capsodis]SFN23114.1 hypothetical protein SAMN05216516_10425 [Izhakiella capsodis]